MSLNGSTSDGCDGYGDQQYYSITDKGRDGDKGLQLVAGATNIQSEQVLMTLSKKLMSCYRIHSAIFAGFARPDSP